MTRRLTLAWPDARPFHGRDGRPIRLLAASDEPDPALEVTANRETLGPIDLVVGCGDLSPERLGFLADAFRAPLAYVRGNHDRGGPWRNPAHVPVDAPGEDERTLSGISLLGLPWPGHRGDTARRDDWVAWRQVLGPIIHAPVHHRTWLVFSHAPPLGYGDTPDDPYHVGFRPYRLLLERLAPPLWLHGHTNCSDRPDRTVAAGRTTVVNVTGSVLVELQPPDVP